MACDVRLQFRDAAEVFAPQKGAPPAQVELLRRRLDTLVDTYIETYGVDVSQQEGGGAAGGLGGGLAAVGAQLVSGFDLIAEELELDELIEESALVVTGEGFLDSESFDGKVVGGVIEAADAAGVAVLVIAGDVVDDISQHLAGVTVPVEVVSLTERFGSERSNADTLGCVAEAIDAHLAAMPQAERRT